MLTYIVNVEGAIYRDGRYLMIVRGAGESHAGGTLSFVGGKVDETRNVENVLEDELRREILEEVGVIVTEEMYYCGSTHFTADDGDRVVDVVFLCQIESGETRIADIDEVAEILWLTVDEITAHPRLPPWVQRDIQRVEAIRRRASW